jgi:hypothetical protein
MSLIFPVGETVGPLPERPALKHQNAAHSGAIIGVKGQSYESIRNAR